MLRHTWSRALLGAAIIAAVAGGYAHVERKVIAVGTTPRIAVGTAQSPRNVALPIDFPTVVERYGPAVVNIGTITAAQRSPRQGPDEIDPDDPFFQF